MMRGFKEVGWVAAVAGTALGCYMVNLKVASERASLEDVENRIVLAQRDIRVLQTEIGTRGRLEQLESWNVKVLALSAPQASQFLEGGFQLATLTAPKKTVDPAAPVVLASAPAPAPSTPPAMAREEQGQTARDLMQVASLKRELPEPTVQKTVDKPRLAEQKPVKATAKAATPSPKPEAKRPAAPTTARQKVAAAATPAKQSSKTATTKKPATTSPPKDSKARQ